MTSWKRLWGKKTKKSLRKIEQRYDQWFHDLHIQYGPDHQALTMTKEDKRGKRTENSADQNSLNN